MSGLQVSHASASSRDSLRRLSTAPVLGGSPQVDVIESKLHAPPPRAGNVSRRTLIDRLSRSAAPVVAIHAAAGYGKTTLLSEWSRVENRPVAWVSLDGGDNDPVGLLSHVAVALDRIEPLPPTVFTALASRSGSVMSTVLPRLGSALAAMTTPVVLLLDDVHSLVEHACLDAIAELAQRLPSGSQLAVTSRTVPGLPLARWRANGVLAEIDVSDLALDATEARTLLRNAGVDLPDEAMAELTRRTEGWPAGLCLAALSLAAGGHTRPLGPAFAGSDRFVADYVQAEVLAQLPGDLVRFLTHTAILDRMCGSLCDAVLQRSGSSQLLGSAEDSQLFLLPLDHHREWYRYHHLFRDVLLTELTSRRPGVAPVLHSRAADWFERQGMHEEALHHAWAAGDEDRAALLLEQLALQLYRTSRLDTLRAWLDRFDEKVMERHPSLAVLAGWTAALTGDAIGAAWWADLAERSCATSPPHGGTTAVSTLHLLHALTCRRGVDQMRKDAQAAVRLEPEAGPWRPAALMLYGASTLLAGDAEQADAILADAVEAAERIDAFPMSSLALAERSLAAMSRGDWTAAETLTRRARITVERGGLETYLPSSITFAVVARTALHSGNVLLAQQEVIRAHRLRPMLTRAIPWLAAQTMIELAQVQLALSDRAGAWTLLADARDIVARVPDLGTLGDQLGELQRRLGQFQVRGVPGPTSLTAAELRLLSYLPTHLSFREIGERFHLSPNTIKSQAISIYRKLSVSARTDAVLRARDIGLLED
ncbi:LuxR C-terminal-related transcriptional regulator [Jiangella aurantiaca]|nr:LuxR C-terminal-related transcriptional regulator [Jiangella aurantiaca]